MAKLKWVLGGLVAIALVVVGGTWVYINVIREDAPPPLALSTTEDVAAEDDADAAQDDERPDEDAPAAESGTNGRGTAGTGTDGTGTSPDERDDEGRALTGEWTVADGSMAGYRVEEILFGQSTEAVGRTEEVTGSVVVDGDTVTDATVEVDMAAVTSDESRRDNQFRTRIMDVANHPTARVVLVEPLELGDVGGAAALEAGEALEVVATVELTLRGTTRTVEMELSAQRRDEEVEVAGSLPVTFADWGIPDPSLPGIDTEDHGVLEVLLVLGRS